MPTRLASLLLAASLLALALASPAQAKRLRFDVLSVKGQQVATWSGSRMFGDCGSIYRGGSQTISFELTRPGRLSLRRLPRYTKAGRRHGFTYYGINFVHTNWTFSRSFHQGPPPLCPPVAAAQASDCGTKGPFAVLVDIGWRAGALSLSGVMDPSKPKPRYQSCEYDGFHEFDLIDAKGRLSQRRLTGGRRTIHVKLSARESGPTAESSGSQTTVLEATVTLRRVR